MRGLVKYRLAVLLAVVLAATLALTACGQKLSPKEAMEGALSASMEMKSFTFDSSLVINELKLPQGASDAAGLLVPDMLRNLSVDIRGAYVRDPMQMELNLKLTIPGDLALTVEIPFILTEDKMYVRIPDIPILPLGDAAGRFVEFDLAEMMEGEGGLLPALNVEVQRKFSSEALGILFKHLDGEGYFRELKKDEIEGLPADLKADRYVMFSVTRDNFDTLLMIALEKVVPELTDLILQSEEYRSMLQVTEDELQEFKETMGADVLEDFRENLEDAKEKLQSFDFSITGAIEGEHMVYQKLNASAEFTEEGEPGAIGFTFDIRYDNINKDVTFEHGIPEDAMTMEEFEQSLFFGGAF